ncbi:DUF2505 domain-containing protein [Actinomyces trachealis]|uniref:DUF2505 domain-containing protein n=1 Tax=Actinomyces trachealis TaxID=2763540 RepID=UPI001892CC59|nr:DUF2505 domain-containing protein [Actinomyces trachealis]
MQSTQTITYPADADAVIAMLSDPVFQRGRIERFGPENLDCQVASQGEGFAATLSGAVPPSRLPAAASRFVRSAVAFTLTETWSGPAADGTRSGNLTVKVKGAPVKAAGTMRMVPGSGSTTVELKLDLRVTVPLVGKSIEDKAMGQISRVVRDEERRAKEYLEAKA